MSETITDATVFCSNPACPYAARFGGPAEYDAGTLACLDCGAETKSRAVVSESPPPAADVGEEIAPAIPVVAVPRDRFTPHALMLIGGVTLIAAFQCKGWVELVVGAIALALCAQGFLLGRGKRIGAIEQRQRGLTFQREVSPWALRWSDVSAVELKETPLPTFRFLRHARVTVTFQLSDGRVLAIEGLAAGVLFLRGPFLEWAREQEAQHRSRAGSSL